MISPNDRLDIDEQPTGLDYWVWRASESSGRANCYYLRYRGVDLTVHNKRAALVAHEGRELVIDHDPKRHKGRGWKAHLCEDIEAAVTTLLAGGGEETSETLGDALRVEIARRKGGGGEEREHWYQWLSDDELPILLGAWLFKAGLMGHKYEVSRHDKLGFTPTSDEFNLGVRAIQANTLWTTMQRLVIARQGA